jgi:DNA-nicking Smr family endonuclease
VSASRRRSRGLSDEERALWQGVTRSVAPLARRRRQTEKPDAPAESGAKDAAPAASDKPKMQGGRPASARRQAAPASPPLAALGRRVKQSLTRGRAPIDARIDLHGLTQSEAHRGLLRFLRRAQADGAKFVLVVTGKGRASTREAADDRGVLRRQVPHWLSLAEFRSLVVGFEPAGPGHGGDGALYVRIRRARSTL